MKRSALLAVLALSACAAPRTYYHDSKTQADFTRDSYDCEQDAYGKASNIGAPGNPLIVRDYYHDCMTRKHGYSTVEGDPAPAPKASPPALPSDDDF